MGLNVSLSPQKKVACRSHSHNKFRLRILKFHWSYLKFSSFDTEFEHKKKKKKRTTKQYLKYNRNRIHFISRFAKTRSLINGGHRANPLPGWMTGLDGTGGVWGEWEWVVVVGRIILTSYRKYTITTKKQNRITVIKETKQRRQQMELRMGWLGWILVGCPDG